jgi:nitronate monooxygenase
MSRKFQSLFGLRHPLIVAPMAGGPTTPELVIASSEAGALGSLGAAYLKPEVIEEQVREIRSRTDKPFAINLFVPSKIGALEPAQLDRAIRATERYRRELGLRSAVLAPPFEEDFERQCEAILRIRPAVFSFVFGVLEKEVLADFRRAGIHCMGAATTVAEAEALEEAGVDSVVAQGIEAGGHRSIHDADAQDPLIPAFDLLRAVKAKCRIPVIAAGGLMNAGQIQESLAVGADAVQLGTAFLCVKEAGTSAAYREKLLEKPKRETRTTRVFSGRLARGIVNRFMTELDPASVLPFPAQNKFTRDLRSASAAAGSPDFLSLWCGTGEGELATCSTAELVERLFPEATSRSR